MVMTKSELLSLAEIKGHEIIYMDFSINEAMSAEINGKCYIGLDALTPEADEKELLAHELGHCEYAGFYSRLTPMNTRERVEYRAHKWQLIHLVPLGELREALKRGITAPWELAEYFDVSEAIIMDACEYYTRVCGPIIDDDAI